MDFNRYGWQERAKSINFIPGIVVPILSTKSCNGSWISVQDYYGFSDEEAIWHILFRGFKGAIIAKTEKNQMML